MSYPPESWHDVLLDILNNRQTSGVGGSRPLHFSLFSLLSGKGLDARANVVYGVQYLLKVEWGFPIPFLL